MRQLSLFNDPSAGLATLMAQVKSAMNASASRCGLSREQIVDKMNATAKSGGVSLCRGNARSVTLATLEKWLNPANSEHIPTLVAVNVFCLVVDNIAPLEAMLNLHGCGVMTPQDKKLRDYADAILEEREAKKRKKQLEMNL